MKPEFVEVKLEVVCSEEVLSVLLVKREAHPMKNSAIDIFKEMLWRN